MLTFFKKNTINLLFIIATFPILFGAFPIISNNEVTQLLSIVAIIIVWFVCGLLIGLHELEDILRDYIKNKKTAYKLIIVSRILIWGFISVLILQLFYDLLGA